MSRQIYPAAVTPFTEYGEVDYPSLTRLVEWFRSSGVDGIVIAGTNGEGPSVSAHERVEILRHLAGQTGNLKVVLGVASNSNAEVKWLCKEAGELGAEAVLVMPPWFFKEAGEVGLRDWYREVMDASPLPVLAYNFPQRIHLEISSELIAALADHENFAGLKDSSGNPDNLTSFRNASVGGRLFVGNEQLLLQAFDAGWSGSISGIANILGRCIKEITELYEDQRESALNKFASLQAAIGAFRTVPQPQSNKSILKRLGILESDRVRLPLTGAGPSSLESLWTACQGLL